MNLRKLLYIKITIFLFLLQLNAQNCSLEWQRKSSDKLDSFILSYRPISGLNYADSVIKLIDEYGCEKSETIYWINYKRAELLESNSKFKSALDIYYSLLTIAKMDRNWKLYSCTHISIARVMEAIGRKEDCLRHLKYAKKSIDTYNLSDLYAFYYVRSSSYHRIFDSKDTAMQLAQLALDFSLKYDQPRQTVDAYLLLGILEENIDSSIFYNKKSVDLFVKQMNFDGAASISLNIVIELKEKKAHELAKTWLDSVYKFIALIHEKNPSYYYTNSKYYQQLAEFYKLNSQLDSAYYYLQFSLKHLENSNFDINHNDVSQAEIDFITSVEQTKSEALLKQSNIQKLLLGILFAGIISGLVFVVNLVKKRRKIEKQGYEIEQQNLKLEQSLHRQSILLSEVHHRVKNNLQLVISLLTLHFNKLKGKVEFQYLEDVSNKVRSIALIHEHLYNSGEFENIELIAYIVELLKYYQELQSVENQFEYILESQEALYLNLETVMPIGIICTELISNSLKYAKPQSEKLILEFSIQRTDSKIVLKYKDNGIQSSSEVKKIVKSGMGTMLIESMIRQLQAQSSTLSYGTSKFNLVFYEKKLSSL
ncbi:MAG: sensor histidine kinase [Saprospiraceae bacterium]|nr:sensor histidine kinase [Saprospiraceae bacterium]